MVVHASVIASAIEAVAAVMAAIGLFVAGAVVADLASCGLLRAGPGAWLRFALREWRDGRASARGELPASTAAARHPPPGLRAEFEAFDRELGITDPELLTAPPTVIGAASKDPDRTAKVDRYLYETEYLAAVSEVGRLTDELERERGKVVEGQRRDASLRDRLKRAERQAEFNQAKAETIAAELTEVASEAWRRKCEIEDLKREIQHTAIERAELYARIEESTSIRGHRQGPPPAKH